MGIFFVVNTHRSLGCWKDAAARAIPTLEGSNPILDGEYKTRTNPIQKCLEVASSLGHSVFAVQDGGWCASSATARNTYKKNGASSACSDNGEGGALANEVYEIVKGKFSYAY